MHSKDQLDAIEKITIAVIAEQLGLKTEEIKHTSAKHELGCDSLDEVEIIMALEEEFDIEIPDSVAFNISDVGYIITHLQSLPDITIDERTWREVERMQHERELKLSKNTPEPKPEPKPVSEMKGIMSDEEFLLIVKQMKGSLDDRSTAAARLVLVHGMTQKAAYLQTESSASNVCGSVKRIRDRHEDILGAYNARFKGQLRG